MTFTPVVSRLGNRCVIYIRVSSKEQLEGHSLDAQRDLCQQFAKSRGWEVVAIFEGEGESAKSDKRKAFQQLVAFVRAGNADIVLTHKIDRFARNLMDALKYLHEFKDMQVTYCSATEQFDFTTPMGWLMLVMLCALAELFLKNLSAETMKGKKKRAEKGFWNGDLSWGYRVAADGTTPEHDPISSVGYKWAVKMFLSGFHSDADIARELNAKGYKTINGTIFSKDTVRSMLQNQFYLGKVSYKGTYYPGKHPPLISETDFERMQEIRRSRRLLPRTPNRQARVYPLSRLCQCTECNRILRGITAGRKNDTRYYWCPDKSQYGGKCKAKTYRNAEHIEHQVSSIFSDIKLPSDWMARTMQYLQADRDFNADERRRSRLNEKLRRLAEMYTDGTYNRDEYSRKVIETKAELDSIKPANTPKLNIGRAAEMLKNFSSLYKEASPEKQQRLFQMMLERVFVAEMDVIALQPTRDFYPLLIYCGPDGGRLSSRFINFPVKIIQPATPTARAPFLISH